MPKPVYDARIGSGFNVALGSLTNIETVTATGDNAPFYYPHMFGYSSPGQPIALLDGLVYRRGFKRGRWHFDAATFNQYLYFSTTWLAGLLSGPVTVYTRVASLTYTRYNAIASLPSPDEQSGSDFYAFKNGLDVALTHMIAI